MADFDDINDLDVTSWLDWMGIDYRRTTGTHGIQLNLRECPVCGGESWKVYLNEETGLGNCFHGDCETKFNKYKFIKATLKTNSFKTVMENIDAYLEVNGWKPKAKIEVKENPFNQTKRFNLPDFIPLPVNGQNLTYLTQRGITAESTAFFGLGFCKNGNFQYLKPDGNLAYRDFSMRVIIPIYDLDGNLATFQGRDITGTAEKKYLFPSGVRATGSLLYNGQNAIGAEQIVINEGVFDVIATWQAFQEDKAMRDIVPVGSFGKHLSGGDSESQIAQLLRLKDKGLKVITFMWDGEARAIQDACRAAQELQKYGFVVRIAVLPGKDPNELPPAIVRKAYWEAGVVSKAFLTRLMLRYK